MTPKVARGALADAMVRDPLAPCTDDPDPEMVELVRGLARHPEDGVRTPVRRADAVDRAIPGPAGPIPLRVLGQLAAPRCLYLRFHGGGWINGAHDEADHLLQAFAVALGAVVVSVGYRTGSGARFPACIDDCETAARWALRQGTEEFATPHVLIGGESAGAHLAAMTLLRLRDRHGTTGIRAADLRYGAYDLRLTPSMRLNPGGWPSREDLESVLDQVVDAPERDTPEASPLLADLSGLPPAIFTCGTADTLLDDTLFMWARWRAAGNAAELALYAGAPHSFDATATRTAAEAKARIVAFLSGWLPGDTGSALPA